MARTHGKILCTIWQDDDFLARSSDAQRLYLALISQPKLNLVGLLDYRPKQLASLAPDTSIEDVDAARAELEEHRFVLADDVTDELLIRSFTRSDPIQMANSKLRKGIWSAWAAIESTALREAAIREMPDDLFDHPEVPPAAARIRRSQRMEPAHDSPSEPPPDRTISDSAIDPPGDSSSTSTSTSTVASASAARPGDPEAVDNPDPQDETEPTARPPLPPVDEVIDPTPPDYDLGLDALRHLRGHLTADTQDHAHP